MAACQHILVAKFRPRVTTPGSVYIPWFTYPVCGPSLQTQFVTLVYIPSS